MLPRAVRVLEEFGGLTVIPPKVPRGKFPAEVLHSIGLAASGEFDRIDYWQCRLKIRLSPIAELGGGAILLLAEDERVFTSFDRLLWIDGSSFEDALNNTLIVTQRRPIKFAEMF